MKNKNKSFFSNLFKIGLSLLVPFSSISLALPASAATDREIMENTGGFVDENLFNCVLGNVLHGYYYSAAADDFQSFRTDYYAGTVTEIPTVVLENLREFRFLPKCVNNMTITDFQGLEKLKGITFLDLSRYKITNTPSFESVLPSFTKLSILILDGAEFDTNKLNLPAMENLGLISLNGSPVTDLDVTQSKQLKYIMNINDKTLHISLTPERFCNESGLECYYLLDLSEYNFFDGYSRDNWNGAGSTPYKSAFTSADDSFAYDSDSKSIIISEDGLAPLPSQTALTLVRTEQVFPSSSNPEGVIVSNINFVFDLLLPDSPDEPENPENEAPETPVIPKAPNTGFFTSTIACKLF